MCSSIMDIFLFKYLIINLIGEYNMNWEQIKGNWNQVKGKAKQKWGQLTDDDLSVIDGNRDEMIGKIQEKYGVSKEAAENEVDDFCKGC